MIRSSEAPRLLSIGALLVFWGILLSGPVAVVLVAFLAPQPSWVDAGLFLEHYSWLQTLPYIFGFLIVGGCVTFMSALMGTGRPDQRPAELTAFGFTLLFAALVFFNYVLQTIFIPQVLNTDHAIVAMTTMANPRSLGWSLEMFGYGLLGIATMIIAPHFGSSGRQEWIKRLLIANGVVSVAGAAAMPLFPGWVLSIGGLVAGATWNVLMAVLMLLAYLEFRLKKSDNEPRS